MRFCVLTKDQATQALVEDVATHPVLSAIVDLRQHAPVHPAQGQVKSAATPVEDQEEFPVGGSQGCMLLRSEPCIKGGEWLVYELPHHEAGVACGRTEDSPS